MKRILPLTLCLLLSPVFLTAQEDDNKISTLQREEMLITIQQNITITDEDLLRALLKIQREKYIPGAYQSMAYTLIPIPDIDETLIPSPLVITEILNEIALMENSRILLMGDGTSYTAALLNEMGHRLWIMDRNYRGPEGKDIHILWTMGWEEWGPEAPFDFILIQSAHKKLPPEILRQLSEEGILVFPLQTDSGLQPLIYINKYAEGIEVQTKGSGFFSVGE